MDHLQSQDEKQVLYERIGSSGIPSPYCNIVDLYLIGFRDIGPVRPIYMDSYFEDYSEDRPVPGFRLVYEPEVETREHDTPSTAKRQF